MSARGRGPAMFGATYRVVMQDGDDFIGIYVGVVIGVTKDSDTLVFWINDDEPVELVVYRDLDHAEHLPEQEWGDLPSSIRRAIRQRVSSGGFGRRK